MVGVECDCAFEEYDCGVGFFVGEYFGVG